MYFNNPGLRKQMNEWGSQGIPFVFLIDFEMAKPQAWKMDALPEGLFFEVNGVQRLPAQRLEPLVPLHWEKHPISKSEYAAKFEQVKAHLNRGDSYLVNLTCPTPVATNWNFEQLFWTVRSKYKIWLKDQFLCFSPETFVQIRDRYIYTYPIKGTINATMPDARSRLLNNPKEAAEHATIVDLLRNDLSQFSDAVTVTHYRNYEEIEVSGGRLGQVYSEIRGLLPDNYQQYLGDILLQLLPAGSVSGAPKNKTVQIIRDVEQKDRGYYTGIFGYFDGSSLDSCVLIRYLQADGSYRSGGGITFQSLLEEEYCEMISKVYVPVP